LYFLIASIRNYELSSQSVDDFKTIFSRIGLPQSGSVSCKSHSMVYLYVLKLIFQLLYTSRSKHVIRSQMDYFGKGFQVFFPKNNFYMQMIFWMNFFVSCSKNIKIFFNASHLFGLKVVNSLQIECFILKNDQKLKSSLKIKISHSLILLYSKL